MKTHISTAAPSVREAKQRASDIADERLEFAQAVSHECCGAVDVVEQFGVFMDIAAPGLNIGLQIGDAVDDGHGNSGLKGWNAGAFSVSMKSKRGSRFLF